MNRNRSLLVKSFAEDDLPIALLFVAFAAFACVLPAQADTFYHLRSGQEMWQSGSLITREPFSWTHLGRPIANHWWLTQLAFYGVHSLGGPMLLTVLSGGIALAALLMSWRLVTGSGEVRLVALLAFGLVLGEWSVRPQVISLLMTMAAIRLLMADRVAALLLLLILWANMHAMVVLGIGIAGTLLLDAIIWDRSSIKRGLVVAVLAVATPFATPFGLRYWPSLIATVQGSRSIGLQEYRSAFNLEAMTILFWVVVVALILCLVRSRRDLATFDRATRLLILSSVVLLPTAVTSVRNIPFFVLAALPALSKLIPPGRESRRRPASGIAWAMLGVGVIVALGFVGLRWSDGGQRLGWRPLTPRAIAAIESCPDRMFNGLYEGGQLIWFVPTRRVFVDGRVEAYPLEFLARARRAELEGDYRQLFGDYQVQCAVVRPGTPMFAALQRDGWMPLTFNDNEWAIFSR